MQMMLAPLARSSSGPLVRWTVLTSFASGLVWAVPAAALWIGAGQPVWLALPVLGVASMVASVLQAHSLVRGLWRSAPEGGELESRTWPAEWAFAVGSIGPNLLLASVAARGMVGAGLGAVVAAGAMALVVSTIVPTFLAQIPAWPAVLALGYRNDGEGWDALLRVVSVWLVLEAGVASALMLWVLLAL